MDPVSLPTRFLHRSRWKASQHVHQGGSTGTAELWGGGNPMAGTAAGRKVRGAGRSTHSVILPASARPPPDLASRWRARLRRGRSGPQISAGS
ncbi:MAG: hypothetical protein ACPIOQ_62740 [Promethearchaeia archaeon]